MIPPAPNPLLDQRLGVGQVAYGFEFDLMSQSGEYLGPLTAQATSITNDSTASIKRTVRGFKLAANEARHVNPYKNNVRVRMRLEDGTSWKFGTFLFTDDMSSLTAGHRWYESTLVDRSRVLIPVTLSPITIPKNGDLQGVLIRFIESRGIFNHDVQLSGPGPGASIGWPSSTTGRDIVDQIGQLGGAASAYFSTDDKLVVKPPPPMDTAQPHEYKPGVHSKLVVDTLQVKRNLLNAPNVYQVECNALGAQAIVARAYIDPALPHSRENLGFEQPDITSLQGVATYEQALAIANAKAETDPRQHLQSSFSSAIDPRVDTYDVLEVDGERYRSMSTETLCKIGEATTHTAAQTVTPDRIGEATS